MHWLRWGAQQCGLCAVHTSRAGKAPMDAALRPAPLCAPLRTDAAKKAAFFIEAHASDAFRGPGHAIPLSKPSSPRAAVRKQGRNRPGNGVRFA